MQKFNMGTADELISKDAIDAFVAIGKAATHPRE
jgi:hypothetical protein